MRLASEARYLPYDGRTNKIAAVAAAISKNAYKSDGERRSFGEVKDALAKLRKKKTKTMKEKPLFNVPRFKLSNTIKCRMNKYVKENGYIPTLLLILKRKHEAVLKGDEKEAKRQDDILLYYYEKYKSEIERELALKKDKIKEGKAAEYRPRSLVESMLD